jgi:hypothetical protein
MFFTPRLIILLHDLAALEMLATAVMLIMLLIVFGEF